MEPIKIFISKYSGQQKVILEFLHQLIISYPKVQGKLTYGIPFYYQKSRVCYLNPRKDGTIELGFPKGYLLSNAQGLLEVKDRKEVRGITFKNFKDIHERSIHEILQEALLIDEIQK